MTSSRATALVRCARLGIVAGAIGAGAGGCAPPSPPVAPNEQGSAPAATPTTEQRGSLPVAVQPAVPSDQNGVRMPSFEIDPETMARSRTEAPVNPKHCCVGRNDCKGKSGCKANRAACGSNGCHTCAGKNDCKGKGTSCPPGSTP